MCLCCQTVELWTSWGKPVRQLSLTNVVPFPFRRRPSIEAQTLLLNRLMIAGDGRFGLGWRQSTPTRLRLDGLGSALRAATGTPPGSNALIFPTMRGALSGPRRGRCVSAGHCKKTAQLARANLSRCPAKISGVCRLRPRITRASGLRSLPITVDRALLCLVKILGAD